jgi:TRAP-type transport system periplasmic protein
MIRIKPATAIIIITLVMAVLLTGCPGIGHNKKESGDGIKLIYADHNHPDGWEATRAVKPWFIRLSAATEGAVEVIPYFSEEMVKGSDIWDATKLGLIDIGWTFHGYHAHKTPLSNVMTLPLLPFKSAKQASGILWELYERYPSIKQEYKENHVLLLWAASPYFLVTKDKQIKRPADLEGLKMRVATGPPVEIMRKLGAEPFTIDMPELNLYLKEEVIDGMAIPWEAVISWEYYREVKYYTYIPLFTVYFSISMNHDRWNSLSPEIQSQINSISGLEGSLFWGENMFDSAEEIAHDIVQQQGYEMIEYTVQEDELVQWKEAVAAPLWNKWVQDMTMKGYPEASDILETCLYLIETYDP